MTLQGEALVRHIAREALAGPPAPRVKARDVYAWLQDPFSAWCAKFAPPDARDPLDPFQEMLFEQGREHEARLVAERHPGAARVDAESEEDAFVHALDAMSQGVPALLGAPLFWGDLHGRADLLVRSDDAPSRFGAWHYVVREIKLAKNLKPHHRLQGAFYNHVLGKLQGYTPPRFSIVNRDGEEVGFDHVEEELLATLRAVREMRPGQRPPAVYGEGLWPWASFADRCAIEADDVSLIGGVGPATRARLVEAGYATVASVQAADVAKLRKVHRIGPKTSVELKTKAEAIRSKRHIVRERVAFPTSRTEIFLDLEGTGAQKGDEGLVEMDYLIGAIVRQGGTERYVSFVAEGLDDEGDMFRRFVAWFVEVDDPVVYHWHHYEVTHLKKLAERHGIHDDARARLFGAMRDLYKDATTSVAFPTYGTSIKLIAPYLGFSWRHKGVNAMASIALFFEYIEDPAARRDKLQLVLDYNEDDCIAMRVVKDWLAANAA